jgi:hypothetical protein
MCSLHFFDYQSAINDPAFLAEVTRQCSDAIWGATLINTVMRRNLGEELCALEEHRE